MAAEFKFLDPLWRRVAVIAAVAVWSAVEWYHGEAFWGTITAGAAAYGAWIYLIAYERKRG